jgi:hypothetical protein
MKLTKILKEVMSEIGDTSNIETYNTSLETKYHDYDEQQFVVRFTTENDTKYAVYIFKQTLDEGETWSMLIEFGVEGENNSYDYSAVTNKGEMYKVMATIVKIAKEMIAKSKKEGQYIREIVIEPSKNFEDDTRRTNLYRAFIEKNMPQGSKIQVQDDLSNIKVILPKQN